MNIEEFKKKYMGKESKWDFSKFSIICNKCKSKKIEFNGFLESESGYYGDHSLEGAIIIKCHKCGNALKMTPEYEWELNKGGEKRINECLKCGDKINKFLEHDYCKECEEEIKQKENEK